jgi:polyferredoxin
MFPLIFPCVSYLVRLYRIYNGLLYLFFFLYICNLILLTSLIELDQYCKWTCPLAVRALKWLSLTNLFGIVFSSLEECGRYLETIKMYENKPADLIQGQMDTDYSSRVTTCYWSPISNQSMNLNKVA